MALQDSPSRRVPLNGLFSQGIWQCNCSPRLPAERCQTKNGGQNHGRWFYSCQKKKPRSCGFFLWVDQAKTREERVLLLNNSRSESRPSETWSPTQPSVSGPSVPSPGKRQSSTGGTHVNYPNIVGSAHTTPSKTLTVSGSTLQEDSEGLDCVDSEDERAMRRATDAAVSMPPPRPLPEFSSSMPMTPRKQARFDANQASPGKRKFAYARSPDGLDADEYDDDDLNLTRSGGVRTHTAWGNRTYETPEKDDDVFTTPDSRMRHHGTGTATTPAGLMTPNETPAPGRFRAMLFGRPAAPNFGANGETGRRAGALGSGRLEESPSITSAGPDGKMPDTELSKDLIAVMHSLQIGMSNEASEAIKAISLRYTRHSRGYEKSRDILRSVLENKKKELESLQSKADEMERYIHRMDEEYSILLNRVEK